MNKVIKGIGFDYSGVIAGIASSQFNQGVCKLLNITLQEYEKQYFKINQLLNTGNLNRDDFWKVFLESFNKLDQHKELINYIDSIDWHKINKEVLDFIDDLKSKGYKLGLFTNNNFSEADGIRERLAKHFDIIVVSSEIDAMKPSPEAFTIFFDKLGVKAEEAVFIDDSKQSLLSSDELKFEPILFVNFETLKKDLSNLGIS